MSVVANPLLVTIINAVEDERIVADAVSAYFDVYEKLFSQGRTSNWVAEQSSRSYIHEQRLQPRFREVSADVVRIIVELNHRANIIRSPSYHQLIEQDERNWLDNKPKRIHIGFFACSDAGIPREAVVGSDHFGRTLAGDFAITWVPEDHAYRPTTSVLSKRIIHGDRTRPLPALQFFIEHTNCGRREQQKVNIDEDNGVAANVRQIIAHLQGLAHHLPGTVGDNVRMIETVQELFEQKLMLSDEGVWLGTVIKLAQRRAFGQLSKTYPSICPYILFDKTNANVYVGLDDLSILTHRLVQRGDGFTPEVLDQLSRSGQIFSLAFEMNQLEERGELADIASIKGQYTFDQLSGEQWLEVKQAIVRLATGFWQRLAIERSSMGGEKLFAQLVDRYLASVLRPFDADLAALDDEEVRQVRNRITNQLFRTMAYAWLLDTFNRGNPPGMDHLEDHAAVGDAAHGITKHLPLGQGGINPLSVPEVLTACQVLSHAKPGKDGTPYIFMMKYDTTQPGTKPLRSEETKCVLADFATVVSELWPYLLVGDIVAVVAVRDLTGGVSRLPTSILEAFNSIHQFRAEGKLNNYVYAVNSRGVMVLVAANQVLQAGVDAAGDLSQFRRSVQHLADSVSDTTYQTTFEIARARSRQ